jgi:hypothetical protein
MARKKLIMVLLILVLVCGAHSQGAFAGPLAPAGWGAIAGGATGVITGFALDFHDMDTVSYILLGTGGLLLLLDWAFSDSPSTALVPQENPVLEHVSFGVVPNAAYVGVNFHF